MRWLGIVWGWFTNPVGMHEADLDSEPRHVTQAYGINADKAKCSCGWKRAGRTNSGAGMADAHERQVRQAGGSQVS